MYMPFFVGYISKLSSSFCEVPCNAAQTQASDSKHQEQYRQIFHQKQPPIEKKRKEIPKTSKRQIPSYLAPSKSASPLTATAPKTTISHDHITAHTLGTRRHGPHLNRKFRGAGTNLRAVG